MDLALAVVQNKSHSGEHWAAVHEHVNGTNQSTSFLQGFMIEN